MMLGSLIVAIFALIFKIRRSQTQVRKKKDLAQKTNSAIGSEPIKQMESTKKENAEPKNESKDRNNYSIGTVTRFLSRNINNDVLRSGKPENTIFVVRKYQRYSFACTLAVIPLILIIIFAVQAETSRIEEITKAIEENTVEIEDPELLSEQELAELRAQTNLSAPPPVLRPIYPFLVAGLSAIPVLILFYPKIQYTGLRRSRKTIVEEEIPFFSLYAAILQSVGMDLYTSFLLTIGKRVFKAMENEALLLKRNVELFARSPLEALEELARNHDSVPFRNFLLGYSSIARSGGDLSRYLENRAEEHFNLLRLRYSAYSRNVGYLVEALITVLVIVPILVVVSAFILPAATISQLIIMSAVAVPLLTIVFAVILANIQPKMFNVVGLNDVIVLAFLPLAIISFMFFTMILGLEAWLALAISAIIPSTINEYFTARHKRQIELIESALPNFLRDLTEYRKIGFHEVTAIIRLSKENTYNKSFD
jgi:flagellar protein FlaJ